MPQSVASMLADIRTPHHRCPVCGKRNPIIRVVGRTARCRKCGEVWPLPARYERYAEMQCNG